jgi:hypothetical protein
MTLPLLKLSFEPPHHGWLPLRIETSEIYEELTASDVPNNPIEDLCDALFKVKRGETASVWLHLEPDGYFLDIEPSGETVLVRLTFAPDSERKRGQELFSIRGGYADMMLVFWRFLRKFEAAKFEEPHWPPTELKGLVGLGSSIKQRVGRQ